MCGAREFGINYQKQAACCVTVCPLLQVQTESRQMMEPIHVLAAKIQPKIVPKILEGCKDSSLEVINLKKNVYHSVKSLAFLFFQQE
jgi:Fe-S-cluster-containing hydrogenase component 2